MHSFESNIALEQSSLPETILKPKKPLTSPQIFRLDSPGLEQFEESITVQNIKSPKSKAATKSLKCHTKNTKIKMISKKIRSLKDERKPLFNLPGSLLGVLKLAKKFIENLKFNVFYNDYRNLSSKHLMIIENLYLEYDNAERIQIMNTKLCFFNRFFGLVSKNVIQLLNWYNRFVNIINPDNTLIFLWNIFFTFFLCFLFLQIPLGASFDIEEVSSTSALFHECVDISTILCLSIDILLSIHLGYYEEGNKIMNRGKIIRRYMGRRALVDFFALLPLALNSSRLAGYAEYNKLKLFIFFKVFKLKELLSSIEVKICLNDFNEGLLKLTKVCCKILYIAHIIACVFHSIGTASLSTDQRSWLNLINHSYLHNWKARYIYSIYWAVTTLITVGYGDITPQNPFEVLFTVFVILVGCGTFAYGINSIGAIFVEMRKKDLELEQEAKILNNFMHRNNLDQELRGRLREYFRYVSKEGISELENESHVLGKLSSSLRHELLLHTTGRALKKIPLLTQNFSEMFLQKLVMKMIQKHFLPEENLFTEQSDETSLYFIVKGQIGVFKREKLLLSVNSEGIFNEGSFITNRYTCYSAQSLTHSTVFYIQRKDFIELLRDFPDDNERFCQLRDKIMLYGEVDSLHLPCELCKRKSHRFLECPFIELRVNKFRVIKRFHEACKAVEDERKPFIRKSLKTRYLVQGPFRTYKTFNTIVSSKISQDYTEDFAAPSMNEEDALDLFQDPNQNQSSEDNSRFKSRSILRVKSREESKQNGFSNHENSVKCRSLYMNDMDRIKCFAFYFARNNVTFVVGKMAGKNKNSSSFPSQRMCRTASIKKLERTSFFKVNEMKTIMKEKK